MKLLIGNIGQPAPINDRMESIWWGLIWDPSSLRPGVRRSRPVGSGWPVAVDTTICVVPGFPLRIVYRRLTPVRGDIAGPARATRSSDGR